ncbi:MAG: response regulator [Bauldia sp.]|nr:response regulator [Bauldia sp.]
MALANDSDEPSLLPSANRPEGGADAAPGPDPAGDDTGSGWPRLLVRPWTNLRLAIKIPLLVVAAAIVAGMAGAVADYSWASRQLRAVAEDKLLGLLQARMVTVSDYLASVGRDLRLGSQTPVVVEGLAALSNGYGLLGPQAAASLYRSYVTENPNPEPRRSRLDQAPDGSAYSAAHALFHPGLRDFAQVYGYRDLLLIDLGGNVIYSVNKRPDFASRVAPDGHGGLAETFRAAIANKASGKVAFVDFTPYQAAAGDLTGFVAAIVYSKAREPLGVLVLALAVDPIDRLMQGAAGLGQTGETLIVGQDLLVRSASRLADDASILQQRSSIDVIKNGFAGESGLGYGREEHANGTVSDVLVAYTPLDFLGTRWVIAAKADTDEIYSPVRAMGQQALVNGFSMALVVAVIGFAITILSVVRPINAVVGAMDEMRNGDRDAPLHLPERGDEIGDVSRALVAFRASLIERDKLDAEKQRESLQAESGRRFRAIAESSPMALIVIEADGGGIRYANPVAHALLGFDADKPLEEPMAAFFESQSEMDRLRGLVMAGLADNVETRLRRVSGETFPAALSSRAFDYDGRAAFAIGLVDLTQIQEAQAEIQRQRERIYQSERIGALGSLLAGVAHELNNPLSVVVAQATMLEELATDQATVTRGGKIRNAAERCARIVKTFLAMARQRPPSRTAVDLNEVVAAALELLSYNLRTAGIEVTADLAPTLPSIWADPDQLSQVVTNLIVNAQQAMADHQGQRRLHVATTADAETHTVCVAVTDSGPGVPADIKARIFEPFFTTKPLGVGTGIGLSVCHGVVSSHGGTIELTDAAGGGAVFRVRLPVGDETGQTAAAPSVPPPVAAGQRILVVDDEPGVAEVLSDILEIDGYAIDLADSGQAALDLIAVHAYDAVISDVHMPDRDGIALYRGIKEVRPELARKLVLVTGDSLGASIQAFLDSTGVPCIEKPFLPAEVRRIVAEMLAGTGPAR